MVMVHNITSAVHQVGHLMASQNRITDGMSSTDVNYRCQSKMPTTPLCMKKIKNQYQLWGLASKPITTSPY